MNIYIYIYKHIYIYIYKYVYGKIKVMFQSPPTRFPRLYQIPHPTFVSWPKTCLQFGLDILVEDSFALVKNVCGVCQAKILRRPSDNKPHGH